MVSIFGARPFKERKGSHPRRTEGMKESAQDQDQDQDPAQAKREPT